MNPLSNVATPTPPSGPNRHKLALLVLVAVYPLITGVLSVLGPLTVPWQVWQRTLVLAPVMVFLLVYFLIPFINKRFRSFLMK